MPFRFHLTRRGALKFGALGAAALLGGPALGHPQDDPDVVALRDLRPGHYVWYPDRAPEGFVAVVVNLTDQLCFVYRNGVRIGVSTVSTGKEGHETPTGVFTILGKDVDHHSSLYNNASMPYSERLTWSGVALHAGGLPGYPSSHGCVHLPLEFAKLLFEATHVGTPVIIADAHDAPEDVVHPGLVMTEGLDEELAVSATGAGAPRDAAAAPQPVSLVVSGADRSVTVLRDGQTVVQGPVIVADPDRPLGNVVYVLATRDGTAPRWTAIAHEGNGVGAGAPQDALARITVGPSVNRQVAAAIIPGSTLFITDLPAHPGTRSDPGFVVMAQEATS